MGDAPSCHLCGAIMTRNGSCFRCQSCGSTSGCSLVTDASFYLEQKSSFLLQVL